MNECITGADSAFKELIVSELEKDGHTVICLGNGVNDAPALSAAGVGIALRNGADITRTMADVVIPGGELESLVKVRELSAALMKRVNKNSSIDIGANTAFMLLGFLGILPVSTIALLHNLTTVAICLDSTSDLI